MLAAQITRYFDQPVTRAIGPEGGDVLVLLHGYGADEVDLLGLAAGLPQDLRIISVRAPLPMNPGYTWYPLRQDLSSDPEAVAAAVTGLDQWVGTLAGSYQRIFLLGFSMGMSMATSLLRMNPQRYQAVIGLSGFAINPGGHPSLEQLFQDEQLREKKPALFWGRDQHDEVIIEELVSYTHQWVREHTELTKVLYDGMGHAICPQELTHISQYLSLHRQEH